MPSFIANIKYIVNYVWNTISHEMPSKTKKLASFFFKSKFESPEDLVELKEKASPLSVQTKKDQPLQNIKQAQEKLEKVGVEKKLGLYLEYVKNWNKEYEEALNDASFDQLENLLNSRKERELEILDDLENSPLSTEETGIKIANLVLGLHLEKTFSSDFQKEDWHQTYHQVSQDIERTQDAIKKFASVFSITSPSAHYLIQNKMKELTERKESLDQKLCQFINLHYTPNDKIKDDGHCLFASIQDLDRRYSIPEYRKKAVEYMQGKLASEDSQEIRDTIKDAMSTQQAKSRLAVYAEEEKGGQTKWTSDLRNRLQREPTEEDFYLDCMMHSTLWGGLNEIKALSQVLERPIFIFSKRDDERLRVDGQFGMAFTEEPLVLYYNGITHYQSLQPRIPSTN